MAKTLKFNLTLGGKMIQKAEDLQDNFYIPDIIRLYRNGTLQRWLKANGYEAELSQIANFTDVDDKTLVYELATIFNVNTTKRDIDEVYAIFEGIKSNKDEVGKFNERNPICKGIVQNYMAEYFRYEEYIFQHPSELENVRECISIITSNYNMLFKIQADQLFNNLYESMQRQIPPMDGYSTVSFTV